MSKITVNFCSHDIDDMSIEELRELERLIDKCFTNSHFYKSFSDFRYTIQTRKEKLRRKEMRER